MDEQTFDMLVSRIYRAAALELPWDAVLKQIRDAFDAQVVLLHTADARDGRILHIDYGADPSHAAVLDYIREYHRADPRRTLVLAGLPDSIGKWQHCHEVLDEALPESHPFYRDFLSSYNARYTSWVVVAPEGTGNPVLTAFGIELSRSRGMLSEQERVHAARMGAHLEDALRLHARMQRLLSRALAGFTLLDRFAYPMWLIDTSREVSFSNPAALRETASERRCVLRAGRLCLLRDRADRRLAACVEALTTRDHGATAVVDLRTTQADPPTWLHLAFLVPEAALGAFGDRPTLLATLFDPMQVSELDPFALAGMFGMTPSESRVAAALGTGQTALQIGGQLGISENTVRTHIRGVLYKLGAARLTDAVRVLRQGEALWSLAGESLL